MSKYRIVSRKIKGDRNAQHHSFRMSIYRISDHFSVDLNFKINGEIVLKNHARTFNTLQKLVDIIGIWLSWFFAYLIRFQIFEGQENLEALFIKLGVFLSAISLYFYTKNGLYTSHRFSSRLKEISAVFKSNLQSTIVFIIVLYFFAQERVSRLALLYYFLFAQFLLITLRLGVRNYLRYIRRKGKNLQHILLMGDGNQLCYFVKEMNSHKDAGVNYLGWIDSSGKNKGFGIKELEYEGIDQAIDKLNPDSIFIGYTPEKTQKIESVLKKIHNNIIPIHIVPEVSYSLIGHKIDDFEGIPLLGINHPSLSNTDLFLKRLFDIISTFFGLLILSPLLIFIGILVKLTSRGPIFYGQERMGLDGKVFKMWKFRSMKVSTDESETPGWTVKNDPRRTKIGTFLRSSSFDELPQLWNVLIGDMSLVGPRPEQPYYVEKFKDDIPAYMLRHKMKAGVTGWAQVNGWRGDTSLQKRIECDIYYIKNWSFIFDIRIILLTFWKGLFGKNAY